MVFFFKNVDKIKAFQVNGNCVYHQQNFINKTSENYFWNNDNENISCKKG